MYYNLRMVYITTPDKATAKNLGHKILKKRLAACANIVDGMESMYWWEGKIEQGSEAVLIAKTTAARDVIPRHRLEIILPAP